MHPQLFHLTNLQKIDSEIRVQDEAIAGVPEALAAVDAREKAMDEELGVRRQGLEEAQKTRRTLEGELDVVKDKLSKYQDQLMQVKTNEAYRAMLSEIETTKKEVARREEKILEQMLLADEIEAAIAGGEKAFQQEKAKLVSERADLDRRRTEAETKKADLVKEREQIAAGIDENVRRTYEKVYRMRQGLAVVGVREELCLGCRVKIRPQVFQEIRIGSELRQCDSCLRFLFFVEPDEEPPAELADGPAPPAAGEATDEPAG